MLLSVGLIDAPVRLTNNYWGVFFSLVITGFPFAFLLILSYLSGIDPTLERAAATLGAGWWQRFRRITLPLLAPGLATTFCLTFVLAFSVFPSAILVGDPAGDTRVISIAAYHAAYERYDYPLASRHRRGHGRGRAAVIAAVLGVAVAALHRIDGRQGLMATAVHRSGRPAGPDRRHARGLAGLGRRSRSSSSTWPG